MSIKIPQFDQLRKTNLKWVLYAAFPLFIIFLAILYFVQAPQSIYITGFEGTGLQTLAGWQVFDPYRTESQYTGTFYTSTTEAYEGSRSLYFQTDVSWNHDTPFSSVSLALFFAPDEKTTEFTNYVIEDGRTWNYLSPVSREDLRITPTIKFMVKLEYKEMIRVDVTGFTLDGEMVGAGVSPEYELRGKDTGDWQSVELNIVELLNSAVGTATWEYLRSFEIRLYNVDMNQRGDPIDLWMDNYVLEAAMEAQREGLFRASGGTIFVTILALSVIIIKRMKGERINE